MSDNVFLAAIGVFFVLTIAGLSALWAWSDYKTNKTSTFWKMWLMRAGATIFVAAALLCLAGLKQNGYF